MRAVGTLTLPEMMSAFSLFVAAIIAFGTFGLTLPRPTPLFLRSKLRFVPPLKLPSAVALIASNTPTSTRFTPDVRMCAPWSD